LVKELEYSDKVAEDFTNMVLSWKDEQGRPVLDAWKQKLNQARQDYKQAKISKAQLAGLEESIVKELSQRIQKEISPDRTLKFFDLADVVKDRQAQCVGYSHLFYVLGSSIDLRVNATNVTETATDQFTPGHVACIVTLTHGKTVMVDIAGDFVSQPFILDKEFTKVGNYWELKDKKNPLRIHKRIQILDRNGMIAHIHSKRGNAYKDSGQFAKAISEHTKAAQLNPKYADAYNNRGNAYGGLKEFSQAISDFSKAIELNPKSDIAYYNRGRTFGTLQQYTQALSDSNEAIKLNPNLSDAYFLRGVTYVNLRQDMLAISDFNKAIELNPKYTEAYYNRGVIYGKLGQHTQAISDYTKAIELNPKYAKAYYNRGVIYGALGKSEEAKKDLLKAVELNPALKPLVKGISDNFKLNLKLD
jgi:tetratricopeptide (TPR) repeat protein